MVRRAERVRLPALAARLDPEELVRWLAAEAVLLARLGRGPVRRQKEASVRLVPAREAERRRDLPGTRVLPVLAERRAPRFASRDARPRRARWPGRRRLRAPPREIF